MTALRIIYPCLIVLSLAAYVAGCKTAQTKGESQETLNAVGSATEAITGKQLTEAEKRKLVEDLKNDKEAQSALKAVSGALDVRQTGIKYCPVDGQRFGSAVEECPVHHVKLKELTD